MKADPTSLKKTIGPVLISLDVLWRNRFAEKRQSGMATAFGHGMTISGASR